LVVKEVKDVYTRVDSATSGPEIKITPSHSFIDTCKNSTTVDVILSVESNQAGRIRHFGTDIFVWPDGRLKLASPVIAAIKNAAFERGAIGLTHHNLDPREAKYAQGTS
jgi:hypothetical protein